MSPLQLGHAAITLGDGTHISWWPTDTTEGKECKKNPRDVGSLDEDIRLEGRRPDKTFAVAGLDETACRKWWRDFLDTGERYHLAIRNCCHIVMNALNAGGFRYKYSWYLVEFMSNVIPDVIMPRIITDVSTSTPLWRRLLQNGPLIDPKEVEKRVMWGVGVEDIS